MNRRARGRDAVAAVMVSAGFLAAACAGTGGPAPPAGRPSPSRTAATTPGGPVSPTAPEPAAAITVTSPAFAAGTRIPARFSCHGANTPPPLRWRRIPAGTASIAVVMDDPDAPGGTYTHWVVFNVPPGVSGIAGGHLPDGAAQARNSGGQAAYLGPCPPSGTHHYRFTVYAERTRLPLPHGAPLPGALHAIKADAVAAGRLTGLFGSG